MREKEREIQKYRSKGRQNEVAKRMYKELSGKAEALQTAAFQQSQQIDDLKTQLKRERHKSQSLILEGEEAIINNRALEDELLSTRE